MEDSKQLLSSIFLRVIFDILVWLKIEEELDNWYEVVLFCKSLRVIRGLVSLLTSIFFGGSMSINTYENSKIDLI